jgi:hypothetical protein
MDGMDTVFEVLAGREGEIDGRRGFWPPGANTICTHSALILDRKRGVGCVKEVLWMGWILYLRCWQAEAVRSTEGGVLPCQTKNQKHCTWYQSSVETVGMGYFRDPWGEGEGVVVMVGGWE